MAGSSGDDWDLDLRPIRPPATPPGADRATAGVGSNGAPLDIVGALSDLKRSVDRLAVRLGRIERALAGDRPADETELATGATRRLRTLGPKPVPAPAAELRPDAGTRHGAGSP